MCVRIPISVGVGYSSPAAYTSPEEVGLFVIILCVVSLAVCWLCDSLYLCGIYVIGGYGLLVPGWDGVDNVHDHPNINVVFVVIFGG